MKKQKYFDAQLSYITFITQIHIILRNCLIYNSVVHFCLHKAYCIVFFFSFLLFSLFSRLHACLTIACKHLTANKTTKQKNLIICFIHLCKWHESFVLYHFFFSIFEYLIYMFKTGEQKVIKDNDSCHLYIIILIL